MRFELSYFTTALDSIIEITVKSSNLQNGVKMSVSNMFFKGEKIFPPHTQGNTHKFQYSAKSVLQRYQKLTSFPHHLCSVQSCRRLCSVCASQSLYPQVSLYFKQQKECSEMLGKLAPRHLTIAMTPTA